MIEQIKVPKELQKHNILTFYINGKIDSISFIQSMRKILKEMDKDNKVNIYLEISSINGVSWQVLWDSVKLGFTSLGEFIENINKIAIVTDSHWLSFLAKVENRLIPKIQERCFATIDRHDALKWLKS